MNKEEAYELHSWISNLIGKTVKYPSGLKQKALTDHVVVSVNPASSNSEEKKAANFRVKVELTHVSSKKTIHTSADEIKIHNPDL